MRKILVLIMAVAMLLSLGSLFVSAELPDNIEFTDGMYCVENPDDFTPVGDIRIEWDPQASQKLDLSDGDMSDWAAAGYNMVTIDATNMISWKGTVDDMPANWNIQTYFVADSEWLYIGFFVTDDEFHYATIGESYSTGDAFQVCIDFGGKLGDILETEPDLLSNPKNIFYSFACFEDNAPLEIRRQESDNNMTLTEANGDGVMGTARKTSSGWSAEFALSFDMMYRDYVWKAFENDPKIYIGGEQNLPLTIGCCLYYLNVASEDGTGRWTAGTTNGIKKDDGTPVVSWTAYDNGINLYLPYEPGMEFECENLVVIAEDETIPEETEAPATEAPVETATPETNAEDVTVADTEDVTNGANQEAGTSDAETSAGGDEQGCGSVVHMGVVAMMMAMAAAVVLKKKD